MYRIMKAENSIQKLEQRTFSSLGFREREHLQEWIAKQPDVFGEDLLIIQKEFDRFDDTSERLDLLALDKQGCLVVIENKLDDSGRDVTWQALKYASYCSGLSKSNITKMFQEYLDKYEGGVCAEDALSDYFDGKEYQDIDLNKGVSQRIILVAANFRKEVTSTVLWLANFKVHIQCFKVTPYALGDDLFMKMEQIIPIPDAEGYMIGMAEKAQDDLDAQRGLQARHIIRRDFWSRLLLQVRANQYTLFQNIGAGTSNWIGAGSGVGGITFNFVVGRKKARVEVYIDRGDISENKEIFDRLVAVKEKIEKDFGEPLIWERLDLKRACRIKAERPGDVNDREQWDAMIDYMLDAMRRLEKAFSSHLGRV